MQLGLRMWRWAALALLSGLAQGAQALEKDLVNGVQTVAGIYGSIWVHELGHAAVYRALGSTDVHITVPRPGTIFSGVTEASLPRPLTAAERQTVAASGLVAANLAGEWVLQQRSLHHSPFAQSVLGTALVSNLLHVTQYYTRRVGENGWRGNDIDLFEAAGGNPHVFSGALLLYTAWSLQRMRQNEIPLFYVNLKF
jgi:hypothetical protein